MPRSIALRAFLLLATLWIAQAAPASAQVDVDIKLVLAVDISMSMDPEEQRLQREGYVAAFRDRFVHTAILGGEHGRIAVSYFEWAGPQVQDILMPWRLIDSAASAEAFAVELLGKPYSRRQRTSISSALIFARTLLRSQEFRSARNVIDVSGDGVNNSGPLMAVARQQVLAEGIVINGLPVLVKPTRNWSAWDAPDLDQYYGTCVIGGPGSFMIPIKAAEDFASATRQKLLLEIASGPPVGGIIPAQLPVPPAAAYDCGEVERRIERRPPWGD